MNLVATRWWSMLFMPSCLLMLGIAVGAAWCLWAWRRGKTPRQAWPGVALLSGSTALLYLASTPLAARWAAWTLERENPPVAVEELPVADAIVVLGGAMYATERADGSVHLYARHASDRFDTGLAAYRAGRAPFMVFGGGGTGVPGTPTEGEWNRARAIERGVPEGAAFAQDARSTCRTNRGWWQSNREIAGRRQSSSAAAQCTCPARRSTIEGWGSPSLPCPRTSPRAARRRSGRGRCSSSGGVALAQMDGVGKEWMGRAAVR
jgi:hypothetical protein